METELRQAGLKGFEVGEENFNSISAACMGGDTESVRENEDFSPILRFLEAVAIAMRGRWWSGEGRRMTVTRRRSSL